MEVVDTLVLAGFGERAACASANVLKNAERVLRVPWCDVTNEALAGVVASEQFRDRRVRHLLRRALKGLFDDALERWPCLSPVNRTAKRCRADEGVGGVDVALPIEVFEMRTEHPVRKIFERLYSHLTLQRGMRSPLSARASMSFLYGFLFADDSYSLVPKRVHEEDDRLVEFLREQTRETVSAAYARYRSASSRLKRRRDDDKVSLGTLSRHLYLITLFFCDVMRVRGVRLSPELFGIASGRRAGKTNDAGSIGSASTVPCQQHSGEHWVHTRSDDGGVKRDHVFTAAEVRSLYLACETLFEKILFTTLFTTGMRRRGFCQANAQKTIVDGRVGEWLWTVEKGGNVMAFPINDVLNGLLTEWIKQDETMMRGGSKFLFPRNGTSSVSPAHVYRVFKAVAARAGLTGSKVHPHTTRHTVAFTLSCLGNKVEDIARVLGHKTPRVTSEVYIALTQTQVMDRLVCPWNSGRSTGGQTLEERAMELASALASPFASPDGRTFPDFSRPPVASKSIVSQRLKSLNEKMKEYAIAQRTLFLSKENTKGPNDQSAAK